jgi:hypothetical protein
MRQPGHVTLTAKTRNVYKIIAWRTDGKKPPGSSKRILKLVLNNEGVRVE